MNFESFFPVDYEPTSQQEFILHELNKAKANNYKYIIINASTGSGKSLIAKTISNYIGDTSEGYKEFVYSDAIFELEEDEVDTVPKEGSVILTMTKSLQDQYMNLFPECSCLKGKSNYPCMKNEEVSCDLGQCVFEKIPFQCEDCIYYNTRREAVANQCGLYSYSMFMSLPPACRIKKAIICDEASELEDILVQSYTMDFNFKLFKTLKLYIPPTPNKNCNYNDYILWLQAFKTSIFESLQEIKLKINKKKTVKKEEKLKYRALKLISEKCTKLLDISPNTEFIIEHHENGLTFKPFKVDKIAQNLFENADLVVFMSATIIDHKNFAKQLGIIENEYYYIESPSVFDPKKAPIKLSDKICVTYANKALTVPKISALASKICDIHKGQKGIIHTHSMDITNEVKKQCKKSRFLFREPGITNEVLLQQHFESNKPTVLVSPSMTHGVDLKGDTGEFAIIMKAPFLPLGDERIKRLFEEDKDWYVDKMLSTFIQMCGRTIRSAEDHSITYVLDGTLTKKLIEYKDRIPKYIQERFC